MSATFTRRKLYLAFYNFCSSLPRHSSCRGVSTTSAINKGLRASRASSLSGRKREGHVAHRAIRDRTSFGNRSSLLRNHGRAAPHGRTRNMLAEDRSTAKGQPATHKGNTRAMQNSIVQPVDYRQQRMNDRHNATGHKFPGEKRFHNLGTMPKQKETYDSESLTNSLDTIKMGRGESLHGEDNNGLLSIPYTTAASEFLYGFNAVVAALRAKRRKLYHLYLHPRAFTRQMDSRAVMALARDAGISVEKNTDSRLLDRMSDNRPHNGLVLEASKLPAPPVLALARPDERTSAIPISLEHQSAEDMAINGSPAAILPRYNSWRHPFIIMLDGIVDPGNLGNILRTAHFYGVDAVAVSTNTCAPLSSAVLAKASSGASEAVRLLALPKPSNFIFESARAGWRIYAAVAPAPPSTKPLTKTKDYSRRISTSTLSRLSPLSHKPCILMLGAEGEGLRQNLLSKADYLLSIDQGARDLSQGVDVGVESLNVAVAAGVLMEGFLRDTSGTKPAKATSRPESNRGSKASQWPPNQSNNLGW